MRAVHTRMRIFDGASAWSIFSDKYALLMWILGVVQNRRLGYETVMYADSATVEHMHRVGLDVLYDEINTELYDHGIANVDLRTFWAMPKIAALRNELENGKQCFMCDNDIILFRNIDLLMENSDVTVWSNKEHTEITTTYPKTEDMSFPDGYSLPKWYVGDAQPLNTGILRFRNAKRGLEYCAEVERYCVGNRNEKNNSNSQIMCFAEQRMIGEYVDHHHLSYSVVQPVREGLFNRNGFHALVHKHHLSGMAPLVEDWIFSMLLKLSEVDPGTYERTIALPLFKDEREAIEDGGRDFSELLMKRKFDEVM